MFKGIMNRGISIKSIWEDEPLFEVKVSGSNGTFSGEANCYTLRSEISKFAESISGYPASLDHTVNFSSGPSDTHSYFECSFSPTHLTAHFKVRVKIVHIVVYTNRPREHAITEFDFNIEAAAVDRFTNSLRAVAGGVLGEAEAILSAKT